MKFGLSERYTPSGSVLVSVCIIGIPELDDRELSRRVVDERGGWFGNEVDTRVPLRAYRIEHALPALTPEALSQPSQALDDGISVSGYYIEGPSINSALISERRSAEEALRRRGI